MAIRKVARLGHPVLRQVAREVPKGDIKSGEIQRLVRDLRETMVEYEGVGLAAPQVFESLRVFVMHPGTAGAGSGEELPTVWINPKLEPIGDARIGGWEGCLSIPEMRGLVPRHASIRVSGFDERGKARDVVYEGFPAIVAQHEYDHLDGIVFLDRMSDFQTLSYLKEFERYHLVEEEE